MNNIANDYEPNFFYSLNCVYLNAIITFAGVYE